MAFVCLVSISMRSKVFRDAREAKRGGTAPGEQRVPKQAQTSQINGGGVGLEKYDISKIYAGNPPKIQKINIASPNIKNISNPTLQSDSGQVQKQKNQFDQSGKPRMKFAQPFGVNRNEPIKLVSFPYQIQSNLELHKC